MQRLHHWQANVVAFLTARMLRGTCDIDWEAHANGGDIEGDGDGKVREMRQLNGGDGDNVTRYTRIGL